MHGSLCQFKYNLIKNLTPSCCGGIDSPTSISIFSDSAAILKIENITTIIKNGYKKAKGHTDFETSYSHIQSHYIEFAKGGVSNRALHKPYFPFEFFLNDL